MPRIAKVFQSGNSQAIRLPKEFRFDVDEVEVSREGDAVILRPRPDAGRPWASPRLLQVSPTRRRSDGARPRQYRGASGLTSPERRSDLGNETLPR